MVMPAFRNNHRQLSFFYVALDACTDEWIFGIESLDFLRNTCSFPCGEYLLVIPKLQVDAVYVDATSERCLLATRVCNINMILAFDNGGSVDCTLELAV